jgi:hypothetical protein
MPHNMIGTEKEIYWHAYVEGVREGDIEQPAPWSPDFMKACWRRALDEIALDATSADVAS